MSSKLHLVESVQKALGKDVSKAHAEKVVNAVIDSVCVSGTMPSRPGSAPKCR